MCARLFDLHTVCSKVRQVLVGVSGSEDRTKCPCELSASLVPHITPLMSVCADEHAYCCSLCSGYFYPLRVKHRAYLLLMMVTSLTFQISALLSANTLMHHLVVAV